MSSQNPTRNRFTSNSRATPTSEHTILKRLKTRRPPKSSATAERASSPDILEQLKEGIARDEEARAVRNVKAQKKVGLEALTEERKALQKEIQQLKDEIGALEKKREGSTVTTADVDSGPAVDSTTVGEDPEAAEPEKKRGVQFGEKRGPYKRGNVLRRRLYKMATGEEIALRRNNATRAAQQYC